MGVVTDISGQQFGRLTVTGFAGVRNRKAYWHCLCDCGTVTKTEGVSLRAGHSRSCGCLAAELMRTREALSKTIHGCRSRDATTPSEYKIWQSMIQRCTNPKRKEYCDYGGRGIVVCERWRQSFTRFLTDVGSRPSRDHSIDRIDNDGNYEPGNVRWATRTEQANNARSNRWIDVNGTPMTLTQAARQFGIHPDTLSQRLRNGWPISRALNQSPAALPARSPDAE